MATIPTLVPITDLRHAAAAIVAGLGDEPVVVTQRGRAAAVLVSVDAYERRERERALLELLARGEQEVRQGQGHDLAEVLAEADTLLADE